jgi:hypothetical protein
MRAAFALIAHLAHVTHVAFRMGDPLGIVRKSGGFRKIECRRGAIDVFREPLGLPTCLPCLPAYIENAMAMQL